MSKPIAIDLFCGAGGMSLGFEQAGFNVAAAFDIEEFNITTHRKNFPDCAAFAVNLAVQSGDTLRDLAQLNRREIDVVFGGPPCQGFSIGGKKDVNDDRNLLVYEFARLVRQLKPKYFVMENVKGLMSDRSRPILYSFIHRIKKAGYEIVLPIRVLNAADYGVPQRRKRTFILGYKKGMSAPSYPQSTNRRIAYELRKPPVVKDAIADLTFLERQEGLFENDVYQGKLAKTNSLYARLMRGEIIDPSDKSANRKKPVHLSGCLRTKHSKQTVERFSATPPGKSESISRYIRLSWDEVAPTIRAGTGIDHGSHTAPRPIHPSLPRCISSREAARLHSIPDWFQFHGTRWHDFRQIGNSVPPFLAWAVAAEIYANTIP